MSNCSNHRKDVHGETDMKHLAEEIGNLHYETLRDFLNALDKKLYADSRKDWRAGRIQIANKLHDASHAIRTARIYIGECWQICKPFMSNEEPNDKRSVATKAQ